MSPVDGAAEAPPDGANNAGFAPVAPKAPPKLRVGYVADAGWLAPANVF